MEPFGFGIALRELCEPFASILFFSGSAVSCGLFRALNAANLLLSLASFPARGACRRLPRLSFYARRQL